MKKFMLLLFLTSMLLAIEQVPRQGNSEEEKKSTVKVDAKQSSGRTISRDTRTQSQNVIQRNDREHDRFQDSNSNGVNDRREDDFQNIKTKKSKYKELIDRKKAQETKREPPEPPKRDSNEAEKKKEK
jgi:hypothetical protein